MRSLHPRAPHCITGASKFPFCCARHADPGHPAMWWYCRTDPRARVGASWACACCKRIWARRVLIDRRPALARAVSPRAASDSNSTETSACPGARPRCIFARHAPSTSSGAARRTSSRMCQAAAWRAPAHSPARARAPPRPPARSPPGGSLHDTRGARHRGQRRRREQLRWRSRSPAACSERARCPHTI